MATQVPPKRGAAFSFECCLTSQADTDIFQTSVTLAAGDVKVSKDGGSLTNIATLPTEIATTGVLTVALSATEMTADRVAVLFHDVAGAQWQDLLVIIHTVTSNQIDDLGTPAATADAVWDEASTGHVDAGKAGAQLWTDVDAILVDTAEIGAAGAGLTAVPWNSGWDAEVQSEVDDALNTQLADSIPADGTIPTLRQAIYMVTQFLIERAVSGTTVTVKKADGSTSLFTLTLNDGTDPTSITRAT